MEAEKKPREKKPKTPRVKAKNDPKLIAAARELRDRWLEHLGANPESLLPAGKYHVSRARALLTNEQAASSPLLIAA